MTIQRQLMAVIAVLAATAQAGSAQGPTRGGFGPGGPGGPGGGADRKIVAQFDHDENGRLSAAGGARRVPSSKVKAAALPGADAAVLAGPAGRADAAVPEGPALQ